MIKEKLTDRLAMNNLLSTLLVTKIIYVDDSFAQGIGIEDLIGIIETATESQLGELAPIFNPVSLIQSNIRTQALRDYWGSLSDNDQKHKITSCFRIVNETYDEDNRIADRIQSYLPPNIQFLKLTPEMWIQQRIDILTQATDQSRILCFFDQNLSGTPGFSDTGSRSGIGLIKDIIELGFDRVTYCCLLTHTILSIENETSRWRELARTEGIELEKFLPLAKCRIKEDVSPYVFIDGVKKAALNTRYEPLKKLFCTLFTESCYESAAQIMDLDVYDFDQIVFQSSFTEGAWEVDTLVRLVNIFLRDGIRRRVLDVGALTSITALIQTSRDIAQVSVNVDGLENNSSRYLQVRPIRRSELYEKAQQLVHIAIDIGDIFETLNQSYILLSQPCDLMVRKKGKRKREDLLAPLIPITRMTREEKTRQYPTYWRTHGEINYYYPDSDDIGVLEFGKAVFVPLRLIDLCVLDNEGRSFLDRGAGKSIPEHLTIGWNKYLSRLVDGFYELATRLDEILEHHQHLEDNVRQKFFSIWTVSELANMSLFREPIYSNGVFDFGVKRIARLRQPQAMKLLSVYTAYLSRDADDVDFADYNGA